MEAREVFGSSPVGPDSVEVTATKEEWAEVLGDIYAGPITDTTRKLIKELESWGVEL